MRRGPTGPWGHVLLYRVHVAGCRFLRRNLTLLSSLTALNISTQWHPFPVSLRHRKTTFFVDVTSCFRRCDFSIETSNVHGKLQVSLLGANLKFQKRFSYYLYIWKRVKSTKVCVGVVKKSRGEWVGALTVHAFHVFSFKMRGDNVTEDEWNIGPLCLLCSRLLTDCSTS